MAIVYQKDKRSGITYAYESISFWDKEKIEPNIKEEREKTAQLYSAAQRSQNAREHKHKSPWSRFNPGWLKQTKENLLATT